MAIISTHAASAAKPHFAAIGGLDCNGYSTIQKPIKQYQPCTDPRGYDGQRFDDNGNYIGHDEPSVQFLSNAPGSGNNMQWSITLPKEHALPATQTFENQVAFWFSLALCDPNYFPQQPCTPDSDKNLGTSGNPKDAGSGIPRNAILSPWLLAVHHPDQL